MANGNNALIRPYVQVYFENPAGVRFERGIGSPDAYSFRILDKDGCDSGYVGSFTPWALAKQRFVWVKKRALDEAQRANPSTVYAVSHGLCANRRIVAALLELSFPSGDVDETDYHAIEEAIADSSVLRCPPLDRVDAILSRTESAFDGYSDMNSLVSMKPEEFTVNENMPNFVIAGDDLSP